MIVCKGCGEPWDFAEMDKNQFLDCFGTRDKIELGVLEEWENYEVTPAWKDLKCRLMIDAINGMCFSCGFSPLYRRKAAAELYVGDTIVNYGKIKKIYGDPPDHSVGIFGGSVEVHYSISKLEAETLETMFDWDEEVLVCRSQ